MHSHAFIIVNFILFIIVYSTVNLCHMSAGIFWRAISGAFHYFLMQVFCVYSIYRSEGSVPRDFSVSERDLTRARNVSQ